MRRTRVPDLSKRCPRCLFRPEHCLCPEIPALTPRTRFLLLRHASERSRATNSGRWAALALGCPILDVGAPGAPLDETPLREEGTWVLFPSGVAAPPAAAPRRVVVLDGSWSQARRMIQRIPALRTLPRLSLPRAAAPSLPRLRRPTVSDGMSTIEAIARALDLLGEPGPAAAIDRLHAAALSRAWSLRGLPEAGGKRVDPSGECA